ncbi:MAG: hypothetical protein HQL42_03675 [Alphaproteobacteria bacterium]|nr:hypothetical protein [Alphaproteobacteria bacterium]
MTDVREELEKTVSLVTAARRLLVGGTMVDLAALEGKVQGICAGIAEMAREDGRTLLPLVEKLLSDLDRLAEAIGERMDPPPADLGAG